MNEKYEDFVNKVAALWLRYLTNFLVKKFNLPPAIPLINILHLWVLTNSVLCVIIYIETKTIDIIERIDL